MRSFRDTGYTQVTTDEKLLKTMIKLLPGVAGDKHKGKLYTYTVSYII